VLRKVPTVVLQPPEDVAATDHVVEQEANEHPTHVVEWRRRWNAVDGTKDDWEVDILEKRQLELLVTYPLDKRCNGAHEEEEDKVIVEATVRKDTVWSNDTPLGIHKQMGNKTSENGDRQ
jgi:hypothetical protein